REGAARRGELVGQVARAHERERLPAFDVVAAVHEDGVEHAERLGSYVRELDGPDVDGGAHLDGDVAGDDPRDDDEGRGARARRGRRAVLRACAGAGGERDRSRVPEDGPYAGAHGGITPLVSDAAPVQGVSAEIASESHERWLFRDEPGRLAS